MIPSIGKVSAIGFEPKDTTVHRSGNSSRMYVPTLSLAVASQPSENMLYLQILSGIVLAWLWISAFKKRKYYSFLVAIVGLVLEFLNRDRNRSVF